MYCSQCGNQLEEDAVFCSKCGTPIQESDLVLKEKASNFVEERNKGLDNKNLIILLCLVIGVLIILCLLIVPNLKNSKESGKLEDSINKDNVSESVEDNINKDKVSENVEESTNKEDIGIQLEELLAVYKGYLEENGYYSNSYCFIYLDNDTVPELLLYDGIGGASLNMVLSYSNGEVVGTKLNEGFINYNEYKNVLYVSGGRQGFYPETVYSLENGVANIIYESYYSEGMDFDSLTYYVDESEVSEESYYEKLYSYVDPKTMQSIGEPYAKTTIESAYDVLINGISADYSMVEYSISRFEIVDNKLYMSTFGNMSNDDTNVTWVSFELADNCEWNRRFIDGTVETGLTYEDAKERIDYAYNSFINDPAGYVIDSATVYGIRVMNNKIVEVYSFNS